VEADTKEEFDPDLKATLDSIVEELIDEVSLGVCFEIHRSCKVGSLFLNDFVEEVSGNDYALIDRPGMDVLGQAPSKKNYECVCPNCQRNLAASRFAPHLEKCMGMGRNSSRIASRRIANNQKHGGGGSEDSGQEDENDNDWNYAPDTKRLKKLKKEKTSHSPRNRKMAKLRNGKNNHSNTGASSASGSAAQGSQVDDTSESTPSYETMTIEERKALLLNSCGVISEHTKKMCTRTGKCSSHTDEQRRQVRQLLLRQSRGLDLEDSHIDIDTYDDTESQNLRESLQWEASSNSSHADSTSTNNSNSGVFAATATSSAPKEANSAPPAKRSNKGSSKSSKSKKQKKTNASSKDHGHSNLYDFS